MPPSLQTHGIVSGSCWLVSSVGCQSLLVLRWNLDYTIFAGRRDNVTSAVQCDGKFVYLSKVLPRNSGGISVLSHLICALK